MPRKPSSVHVAFLGLRYVPCLYATQRTVTPLVDTVILAKSNKCLPARSKCWERCCLQSSSQMTRPLASPCAICRCCVFVCLCVCVSVNLRVSRCVAVCVYLCVSVCDLTRRLFEQHDHPLDAPTPFVMIIETHGSNNEHDQEKLLQFLEEAMDQGVHRCGHLKWHTACVSCHRRLVQAWWRMEWLLRTTHKRLVCGLCESPLPLVSALQAWYTNMTYRCLCL